MVDSKHAFVALCLLVAAFAGLLLTNHGNASGISGAQAGGPGAQGGAAWAAGSAGGYAAAGVGGSASAGEVQVVSVRALSSGGYDHPSVSVKAGVPVSFDCSAEPGAGCGRQLIIDNVGVNLVSRNGETVSATFTPTSPGQYAYHCGMWMFRGVLTAG